MTWHSCSSQEEHVLKPDDGLIFYAPLQLLLARGACIETHETYELHYVTKLLLARGACIETLSLPRSSTLTVLLLARGACIETTLRLLKKWTCGCSSQEEHVLKLLIII